MPDAILLIEDDPDHALLIRRALGRSGRSAEWVSSTEAALEWLEEHPVPSLVLLDLNLPGRSGHELLHRLRRPPYDLQVPVVVLTSSEARRDRERALLAGASGYEVKSGRIAELTETLARVTRRWVAASSARRVGLLASRQTTDALRARLVDVVRGLDDATLVPEDENADVALVVGADDLEELLDAVPESAVPVVVWLGAADALDAVDAGTPVILPDELTSARLCRAIQVAEANRRLVRQLRRERVEHQRFAALVAHDLKAPVRHLTGLSRVVREALDGIDCPTDARHLLDLLVERGEYASEMVDALLGHVVRGVRLEDACSLDAALDDALRALSELVDGAGPLIRRAPLPTVRGDVVELSRLFQNLIQNAIAYRVADRRLLIEVTAQRRHDGGMSVLVSDNGQGIGADDVERVFQPLVRATRSGQGSGLGLDIVRRVMDAHGGSVRLASELGVGSTFILDFPSNTGAA
jgi:signal transduction histidine kinase